MPAGEETIESQTMDEIRIHFSIYLSMKTDVYLGDQQHSLIKVPGFMSSVTLAIIPTLVLSFFHQFRK